MTTIAGLTEALQTVLTTAADTLARETGAVQRASKLGGAALVQTLVLGWLHAPAASLGQLAQMAATLGVPITPQGLDQRLTAKTADCLEGLVRVAVREVVAAQPVAIPLLQRFAAVTVQDSSTVALPAALVDRWRGSGHGVDPTAASTAAVKLQVRCDLCTGRLEGPLLEAGRAQDRSAAFQSQEEAPLPPKALRLADLGYFSLAVFADLAAQDVDFLSRLQVQTAVFTAHPGAGAGTRLDVVSRLRRQELAPLDLPVRLGVDHQLPARLLAVRVPLAVAAERRRRLQAEARKKGQAVSRARLQWADWTVLVTNVPATLLTVQEALVLLRARWQIELLFKLWKQHGLLDEWRSAKPWRILCEVYAKLLALVIQHWLLLISCWAVPARSLVKAAQTVRSAGPLLASALAGVLPLARALDHLCRTIRRGCRQNPRKAAPNTYRLLLALNPCSSDTPATHPLHASA